MKKMLLVLVAAVALSCVYSSPAAAQTAAAIVKVPFKFIAAGRVLPAGSYRIEPQTPDWSVVKISNVAEKSGASVFVATYHNESAEPAEREANVRFVTYGGQHFLQQVYIPGRSPREVAITRSRAQQMLVKLNLMNAEPVNEAK